jgi:putative membrane protein
MFTRVMAAGAAAILTLVTGCGGHTARTSAAHSPGVSSRDRAWLTAAHETNLAEVEAGGLAKAKAATPAVRAAGVMLITDHIRMDTDLVRVARALGVRLPASAAPQDAAAASRLGNESGSTFDSDFVATMIIGHEKAIALTSAEAREGSSPQVITLARQSLPVLQKHLTTMRKTAPSG